MNPPATDSQAGIFISHKAGLSSSKALFKWPIISFKFTFKNPYLLEKKSFENCEFASKCLKFRQDTSGEPQLCHCPPVSTSVQLVILVLVRYLRPHMWSNSRVLVTKLIHLEYLAKKKCH